MKDFATLARQATEALLEQKMLTVRHEAGWQREGFPLPVKRMPVSADGSVVQDYRSFKEKDSAICARKSAEMQYGFHANHGTKS